MPIVRIAFILDFILALGLFAVALPVSQAGAAEVSPRVCLSKVQQREAVASGRAIPLAQARDAIKSIGRRDNIRAQLCEGSNGLVYVLTLLSRSGKVSRVTIDASTGAILRGR